MNKVHILKCVQVVGPTCRLPLLFMNPTFAYTHHYLLPLMLCLYRVIKSSTEHETINSKYDFVKCQRDPDARR